MIVVAAATGDASGTAGIANVTGIAIPAGGGAAVATGAVTEFCLGDDICNDTFGNVRGL